MIIESSAFTSVFDLNRAFVELKRAGMEALGIPQSLEHYTKIGADALGLYRVSRGGDCLVARGSLEKLRQFVASSPGRFVLKVRI